MDVVIDVSKDEGNFLLFCNAASFDLDFGGLIVTMSADQFAQLCDNLRPWIIEEPTT